MKRGFNKLERLAIAGFLAPYLRDKRPRKIMTVDGDGRIVRTIDDLKLSESLLSRARIELAVSDAVRRTLCKNYNDCGQKLRTQTGKTGLCRACSARKTAGTISAAARKAGGAKGGRLSASAMTPEQRRGPKLLSADEKRKRSQRLQSLTAEQRSVRARKAALGRSDEQRRELARRAGLASAAKRQAAREAGGSR